YGDSRKAPDGGFVAIPGPRCHYFRNAGEPVNRAEDTAWFRPEDRRIRGWAARRPAAAREFLVFAVSSPRRHEAILARHGFIAQVDALGAAPPMVEDISGRFRRYRLLA